MSRRATTAVRTSPSPRHGRERVFAAATVLFRRQGYDATSMSDIAGLAGVTKAGVYRHAKSKSELLHAVTGSTRSALLSLPGSDVEAGRRSVGAVGALLRALADVAAADPDGHALVWGAGRATDSEGREFVCRETVFLRLVELLERAVAEGDVGDDVEPWLLARLLLGAMAAPDWFPGEPTPSSSAAVDGLLAGLRPAQES